MSAAAVSSTPSFSFGGSFGQASVAQPSIGQPLHTAPINVGTAKVKLVPYEEQSNDYDENNNFIPNRTFRYESISLQPECCHFSHEELRLADYASGTGGSRADSIKKSSSMSSFVPLHKNLIPDTKRTNMHLDLLHGPGFDVCVGEKDIPNADRDVYDTWCLPQALISHYSPFLEAACTRDFKERQEKRIELPEDDPQIFGLFVEWMYYGDYEVKLPILEGNTYEDINVDAQCWVLGDKFLCPEFKNHAMARLYAQHTRSFAPRTVTTSDVQFACEETAPDSKLRQFYFHFVITYLPKSLPLKGTKEEWDKLLLSHTDAMAVLLQGYRAAPRRPKLIKDVQEYMEREESITKELRELKLNENSL